VTVLAEESTTMPVVDFTPLKVNKSVEATAAV